MANHNFVKLRPGMPWKNSFHRVKGLTVNLTTDPRCIVAEILQSLHDERWNALELVKIEGSGRKDGELDVSLEKQPKLRRVNLKGVALRMLELPTGLDTLLLREIRRCRSVNALEIVVPDKIRTVAAHHCQVPIDLSFCLQAEVINVSKSHVTGLPLYLKPLLNLTLMLNTYVLPEQTDEEVEVCRKIEDGITFDTLRVDATPFYHYGLNEHLDKVWSKLSLYDVTVKQEHLNVPVMNIVSCFIEVDKFEGQKLLLKGCRCWGKQEFAIQEKTEFDNVMGLGPVASFSQCKEVSINRCSFTDRALNTVAIDPEKTIDSLTVTGLFPDYTGMIQHLQEVAKVLNWTDLVDEPNFS